RLREEYDESRSRLALIARLVLGLGATATKALILDRAGVSVFLSALALGSGRTRDIVVLSTTGGHSTRLALALCAAGLKRDHAAAQFALIHPDALLPA